MRRLTLVCATVLVSAIGMFGDSLSEARQDAQLRAMLDELARSKSLALADLDKPYFVEYDIGDTQEVGMSASLGGLIASQRSRFRSPRIQVRVGDYKFDNTNSVFSAFPRIGFMPIDDDYGVMRDSLWLITDAIYKAATEQMTRKRNALREAANPDKTPDFAAATTVQVLQPLQEFTFDRGKWEGILRRVSGKFAAFPELHNSGMGLRVISSTYRLVNSEGTIVRVPQNLNSITLRTETQASDGSYVWNYVSFNPISPEKFPDEATLTKSALAVASETSALLKAPVSDDYSGPVLFEQEAAAQMMASVLADTIRLTRKPMAPPGANEQQVLESVWAGKVSSKVLPSWMSLVDDPSILEWHGVGLAGAYDVDDEGVKAQKVVVVDKGVFKSFLSSRQPIRDINASNGHGRLPSGYGAQAGIMGNLFVEATETTPETKMKAALIEKVKSSGAKFGLLIRRIDFPFAANLEELQSMAQQLQKNGYVRTLSSPILAYRVYLDGHEELVRGLRFKEFSAKDLRDIDAVSDQPYVLNYINSGSSFNIAEMAAEATLSSVICPSILFDSLELARAENETGKQPLVPAPALTAER